MSVFEVAQLTVNPARAEDFERNIVKMMGVVSAADKCSGVQVLHGIEEPNRCLLLVEWDNVEAHQAFAASEGFGPFVQELMEYLAEPPSAMHYKRSADEV